MDTLSFDVAFHNHLFSPRLDSSPLIAVKICMIVVSYRSCLGVMSIMTTSRCLTAVNLDVVKFRNNA